MHTEVKIITGAEAIREHIDELMHLAKDDGVTHVYGVSNLDNVRKNFQEFEFNSAQPSREDVQLHSKLIYTSSEGPVLKPMDALSRRSTRFFPSGSQPFTADFAIVGDTVLFLELDDDAKQPPTAISITSAKFAAEMSSFFSSLWELLRNGN